MTATGRKPGTRAERRHYWCFLVRCRLEEGAGPAREPGWRFTVEQPGGYPARRSFACLHDVAAHLEAELSSCGPLAEDKLISTQERKP